MTVSRAGWSGREDAEAAALHVELDERDIAQRAFEIWLVEGGRAEDNWSEAIRQLREERAGG